MKKTIILLLAILFIFPSSVFAEEEWSGVQTNYGSIVCWNGNRDVGTDVAYTNGVYSMVDPIQSFSLGEWYDETISKVYICPYTSQTVCDSVYVFNRDSTCYVTSSARGRIGIALKNGDKSLSKFYIGNGYKEENGKYVLTDYEEYPITDYNHAQYLGNNFEGKYICDNYGKSCSAMYRIGQPGNNMGGNPFTYLESVDNYYLISDSFEKREGEYYLINPRKAYRTSGGGEEGYSCHSQEDHCTEIYRLSITNVYDGHDGRKIVYTLLEIEDRAIEKEVEIQETYNVSTFFREEEISKVFSTKPEIAEIVNGELVLYRVGATDLIYEDDTTYKVIHLTVTQEALSGNPKTRNTAIFTILLGLLLITSMIALQKKYSL